MKSTWTLGTLVVAIHLWPAAILADEPAPLPVIQDLNLEKLWGKYYEIGSYLQWMEEGCSNSIVSFGPRDEPGTSKITLECDRGWFHPRVSGEAIPIDPGVLARSIATFHPPVGDDFVEEFDIIMVGPQYEWVVIGHPKRHLLWVLSRDAAMPTDHLIAILDRLDQEYGYANVRKNLTCTEHRRIPKGLCKDALHERAWFDDLIDY